MSTRPEVPASYLADLLDQARGTLADVDDLVDGIDPSATDASVHDLVRRMASMRRLLDRVEVRLTKPEEANVIAMPMTAEAPAA